MMNKPDENGPYIWLRYTTQYTRDGRTHTMEMGVPIPVGADAETRAMLIREAEAGMEQLVDHVEQNISQIVPRVQPLPQNVPTPNQGTRTAPQPRPVAMGNRPAAAPAPLTTTQPSTGRDTQTEQNGARNTTAATTRQQHVGASMPLTIGPTNNNSGNLLLPEFIQYIKEYLNLNPKQAMEILKVRSLSTGINLREALEQLKQVVGLNAVNDPPVADKPSEQDSDRSNEEPDNDELDEDVSRPIAFTIPGARSTAIPRQSENLYPESQDRPEPQIIQMHEARPAYGFDEEVDPDEVTMRDLEDFDLEDPPFSPQELERARTKIRELRESQGASVASASRLQALTNVVISQITEEHLQELTEGIWNISMLKRLKKDQVEALISWGKEDDFASEVDAVLAILEEE